MEDRGQRVAQPNVFVERSVLPRAFGFSSLLLDAVETSLRALRRDAQSGVAFLSLRACIGVSMRQLIDREDILSYAIVLSSPSHGHMG